MGKDKWNEKFPECWTMTYHSWLGNTTLVLDAHTIHDVLGRMHIFTYVVTKTIEQSPTRETDIHLTNAIFCDVAPCISCVNRSVGGKYRLHLQGKKIRERETSVSRWLQTKPPVSLPSCSYIAGCFRVVAQSAATCSRWFLAHELFYPEYGGDMFLRNVGSHKIYTAPHPRRRHSS
jgi:hypothetical protein